MKTQFSKRLITFLLAPLLAIFSLLWTPEPPNLSEKTSPGYWLVMNGKVKSMEYYSHDAEGCLIDFGEHNFNEEGIQTKWKFLDDRYETSFQYDHSTKHKSTEVSLNVRSLSRETVHHNDYLFSERIWKDSLNEKNQLIIQSEYENQKLRTKLYLDYNSKGELIATNLTNYERRDMYQECFEYHENGKLKKAIRLSSDREFPIGTTKIYTYNSEGKITSFEIDHLGSKRKSLVIYCYDEGGNLVYQKDWKSDGSSYSERKIRYSDKGIKLDSTFQRYISFDPYHEAATLFEDEIYFFNQDGKIIEQVLKKKGEIIDNTFFHYDEKLMLIKEVSCQSRYLEKRFYKHGIPELRQFYNNHDSLILEKRNVLSFDAYQNLTEAQMYRNDTLKETYKRIYTYY